MTLSKNYKDMLSVFKNRAVRTILIVISIAIGWIASNLYERLESSAISFKTDKDVSVAIDERGRLHILDLQNQNVTIYTDTVAYAIHSKISTELHRDYLNKTK